MIKIRKIRKFCILESDIQTRAHSEVLFAHNVGAGAIPVWGGGRDFTCGNIVGEGGGGLHLAASCGWGDGCV